MGLFEGFHRSENPGLKTDGKERTARVSLAIFDTQGFAAQEVQ